MSEAFRHHTGKVATLPRANVDTDQIIPKQFLKRVERDGFGPLLFHDWRFRPDGTLDPAFELNRPEAQGATILVTGANFGCGSSREHAVWALRQYGFRAVIAASFADIFYSNCCENGLPAVRVDADVVAEITRRVNGQRDYALTVDLDALVVHDGHDLRAPFMIDGYHRELLLEGLDPIGRTLRDEPRIAAYEARQAS